MKIAVKTPAEFKKDCMKLLDQLATGELARITVVDGGRVIAVAQVPGENASARKAP